MIGRVRQAEIGQKKIPVEEWNRIAEVVNRRSYRPSGTETSYAILPGDVAQPPQRTLALGVTKAPSGVTYPAQTAAMVDGLNDGYVYVLPVELKRVLWGDWEDHFNLKSLGRNTSNAVAMGDWSVPAGSLFYVSEGVTVLVSHLAGPGWWIVGVPYTTVRIVLKSAFNPIMRTASAAIIDSYLKEISGTIYVADPCGIFGAASAGNYGYAVFMPDTGLYELVQLQC